LRGSEVELGTIGPLKLNLSKTIDGPMRKYPRIEIDQLAYDGLQIEAVLRHKTTREIATEALLSHISKEALSVLDHRTIGPETTRPKDIATKRPLDHMTTEATAINSSDSTGPDVSQKRKRLFENPDALQQIKTMWAEGVHNGTEIAKRINYPKATVAENIKKMKERRELE